MERDGRRVVEFLQNPEKMASICTILGKDLKCLVAVRVTVVDPPFIAPAVSRRMNRLEVPPSGAKRKDRLRVVGSHGPYRTLAPEGDPINKEKR